jgi:hypothetical protein
MDAMLNKPEKSAEKSTPRPLAGRRQAGVTRSAEVGTKDGPAPRAMAASSTAIHQDRDAGEDRFRLIAERAYFRAEARGFRPGQELDDWLAAEIEVDEMLGHAEPRV